MYSLLTKLLSPNVVRASLGVAVLLVASSSVPEAKADSMPGSSGPTYSPGSGGSGADPQYFITFNIGLESGTISLDATSLGGGEFNATSGSLTVTGGSFLGAYSLIGGGPSLVNPSLIDGPFGYDDDLFPSQNPSLDFGGLLFQTPTGEINIFAIASGYEFEEFTGSDTTNCSSSCTYTVYVASPGTFTITSTPDPTSVILLSTILLAVALLTRKRLVGPGRTNR
jgi:hypothetical protein